MVNAFYTADRKTTQYILELWAFVVSEGQDLVTADAHQEAVHIHMFLEVLQRTARFIPQLFFYCDKIKF